MHSVFLGLAASTVVFFAAASVAAVVPLTRDPVALHSILGIFQTLLGCLTHSVVFIYFIGTGRAVREMVEKNSLDLQALQMTRRFKARAFPFAFHSILLLILAAVLGGAASRAPALFGWHIGAVAVAFLGNVGSFVVEYRVIRENQKLLAQIFTAKG